MANKKNTRRKKKKGGRKLEFTIYIIAGLLVCLVVAGIVKGVSGFFEDPSVESSSPAGTTTSESSSVVSSMSSGVQEQSSAGSIPSTQEESAMTDSNPSSTASTTSPSTSSTAPTKKEDYITYTKTGVEELTEWYLLLVNPTSTIGSDWVTNMTYVNDTEQLDSRIVEAYRDMVAAASADGVSIYAISGYRPYSTQQRLYNNRVERAKRENPSFSQSEAEAYAATHVARPGTSEHQTGLAIDFNSVETSFGSTKAGQWLKEHANDYGFVLRYEADKQSKTNVTWEPWHYRFVGVKHAKRMTQLGYCLEEYIDYIKAGGQ